MNPSATAAGSRRGQSGGRSAGAVRRRAHDNVEAVRRRLTLVVGSLALLAAVGFALAYGSHSSSGARSRPPASVAGPDRPLLAVVGASFSAGVGARSRRAAWPEDLARLLRWRLAVQADPGAGYVSPGQGHRGPFSRLAARLDLAARDPRVIIIQGGHDDIGRSLALVRARVTSLVDEVHREAPGALLSVLSVFSRGHRPSDAAWATDRTIVAAARAADPGVLVFDPLAGHWHFPRIGDHLHPSPAGHAWIARRLAAGLRRRLGAIH